MQSNLKGRSAVKEIISTLTSYAKWSILIAVPKYIWPKTNFNVIN